MVQRGWQAHVLGKAEHTFTECALQCGNVHQTPPARCADTRPRPRSPPAR